ncbi:hypothetical protein D3C84_913460 [compost metagenome]
MMMRSPARSPWLINHSSPCQSPTSTTRCSGLFSASTTHTKWALAPSSTAFCGTRIAFGRDAPMARARTNWPGRSKPLGLASSARTRNVPVCWLKDGARKFTCPRSGTTMPSASTTSMTKSPCGGNLRRPVLISSRYLSVSFSEKLKLTYIGSICETDVSRPDSPGVM